MDPEQGNHESQSVEFYTNMKIIAKGTYTIFSSSIIGILLAYLSKILIIRYLNPAQYGILSLSITFIGIFTTIFSLGIPGGLVRQASFEFGKGNKKEAEKMFTTSFFFMLIFSFFAAFSLYFFSPFIASIMHKSELVLPLKIFSLTLPFVMLRVLIVNIYRCFNRTDVMALFTNILPNAVKLLSVAIIVYFTLTFKYVVIFYSLPFILPSLPLFVYFFRTMEVKIKNISLNAFRKVLKYSLPLYIPGLINIASSNIANIIMGIYLTSAAIGIYFASSSLASMLGLFLTSVNFLYYPLASSICGKGKFEEIKDLYISITKWVVFFFFPFFLVCILFPKALLLHLFRKNYYLGWKVLLLLAIGYSIHTALGPNGMTLFALGKPESATYMSLAGFVANTTLSILLIPKIGILGAGISFLVSAFIQNILASLWLYKSYKIHAFTKEVLGPFAVSTMIALFFRLTFLKTYQPRLWHYLFLIPLFYAIYFAFMLLLKCIDETDLKLMKALERKLGINLRLLKKIVKKII